MGGIRYEVRDGRSYEVLGGMYEVGMNDVLYEVRGTRGGGKLNKVAGTRCSYEIRMEGLRVQGMRCEMRHKTMQTIV
jgi:hypothetical protein